MPDKAKNATIDWTQWLCVGPRRVFSDEELARGGGQAWPRWLDYYLLSSLLMLLALNWRQMPAQAALWVVAVSNVLLQIGTLTAQFVLWRRPTRRRLNVAMFAMLAGSIASLLLFKRFGERALLEVMVVVVASESALISVSWLFLTIYRVQQIEATLRELDERDRHLMLARRLATAQIQPHFLFNTLASLQHWVDTQDPRAGTTLRSFTRYLRATLPMFERESISLAEELQIVRSYLEIMQARLGARLTWTVQADARLDTLPLPPGLLLTLVENAIGHGIEPSLRGGSIDVRMSQSGARVYLEVQDDGAGLNAPCQDGVGLTNTRERLQQLYGTGVHLSLTSALPGRGCLARIDIPWEPSTT